MKDKTFTIVCVVDNHPRFFTELILWVQCVERYIPKEKFTPMVYFVGSINLELSDWLASKGISCKTTETVLPESPHCNKIAPFLDDFNSDYLIVTDVDMFFVHEPSNLFGSDNRIRAAPNNACNPPVRIFKNILDACGLDRPYRPGLSLYRDDFYRSEQGIRESHINNICAAITALPCSKSRHFALRWRYWAEWLVANRSILEHWAIYVDQVAFCLAAEDIRDDVEFLPAQVNTILHSLGEIDTVYAFHLSSGHIPLFPKLFNADKTMNPSGFSTGVIDAVAMLNSCILQAVQDIQSLVTTRDHLDNFLNPQWLR